MPINFKRIDRLRTDRTKGRRTEKSRSADLPLDHQLTFSPDFTEKWQYKEGHVLINEQDVNELVNQNPNDISLLSGLSSALEGYRKFVWSKGGLGHAKFNASINSLQCKIIGRLGSIYEGMVGGVHYEYANDILWINNVNIKAVIALYRLRPTVKAKSYLRGLRDKLFLIIARQQSNPRVNGMHEVVNGLIEEIESVLKSHTPTDTHLLVADTRLERERAC